MMISAKVRFIMEIIRKELVIFDLPKTRVEAILDEREYPRIDDSFDYLTRMPIYTLTLERKEELLRDEANTARYDRYRRLADAANVRFGGRLGSYQYFDMHQVAAQAMAAVTEELGRPAAPGGAGWDLASRRRAA